MYCTVYVLYTTWDLQIYIGFRHVKQDRRSRNFLGNYPSPTISGVGLEQGVTERLIPRCESCPPTPNKHLYGALQ